MVRLFLMALALGALLANPASAHRLALFAAATGAEISGKAYFAGGSPARGITVQISAEDGTVLGETTTAEDGSFAFAATQRIDHIMTADSGDGHVATFTIGADELPHSLPGGTLAPAPSATAPMPIPSPAATATDLDERIETAVARQLRPLREQLAAFEDEIRLRDVIGGIGYIVGIAGLLAWVAARRKGGK